MAVFVIEILTVATSLHLKPTLSFGSQSLRSTVSAIPKRKPSCESWAESSTGGLGNAKLATLEILRIYLGVSSLSPLLSVCRDVTH